MKVLIFLLVNIFVLSLHAHTSTEWRSRSIYQLLTDRFARTDGGSSPCSDISNYCGGTFKGILNNLDYIQGMGFDAIWISPIVANIPGGYHGYWAKNLYEINENFGTEEEFKVLVEECHKRDVWVMIDVVANHMAPLTATGDYSQYTPFNDAAYYHPELDCGAIEPQNQTQMEICWLAKLPDLNQDIPFVKDKLIEWIGEMIAKYNIDGLRIDTVPYVSKEFWKEFTASAGVYTIGEVFNQVLPYDAGYQGSLDAVLNYPLFFTIREVFQQKGSMYKIEKYYRDDDPGWPDATLLGNFVDNHDNARFLFGNSDKIAFKAALAFALTTVGIPITYYGSEQAYSGGNDPQNREPLWTAMNKDSDIYEFLGKINKFRKESQYYKHPQIQRYADDNIYVFTRENYLFAFTNVQDNQIRTITYHNYTEGALLCNLFFESDCMTVQDGKFSIQLNGGEVKVFYIKGSDNTASSGQNDVINVAESGIRQGAMDSLTVNTVSSFLNRRRRFRFDNSASGDQNIKELGVFP